MALTETTYGKLHYSGITFGELANGVNPHLKCPICSYAWQPKLTLGTTFAATFDFSQKASFNIPTHTNHYTGQECQASNHNIELYVAVHKDANGTQLRIQRSDAEGAEGIKQNWWQRP
jgi:hypothetical protein